MKRLAFLLVPIGCQLTPAPVLPPPDVGGTCETAWATAERLGGCGVVAASWIERCHDADRAEEALGIRLPVGCMTASETCDEWRACR